MLLACGGAWETLGGMFKSLILYCIPYLYHLNFSLYFLKLWQYFDLILNVNECRYSHKHTDVYKLALELSEFVFDKLQIHYPCVFQHLNKILNVEGFTNGEASLGRSPFTSFVVTRDYNVRPHVDQDDYDFGFIIWLQEGIYFFLLYSSSFNLYILGLLEIVCFINVRFLHCRSRGG